jgi:hypothetical protein
MATCPACGIEAGADSAECPRCHLSVTLFDSIREAAGPSGTSDPTYLRTIGELLATVDLTTAVSPRPEPAHGLLSRPDRGADLPEPSTVSRSTARAAPPIERVLDFPPAPSASEPLSEVKHRLDEYFRLGRRLSVDFTDFESRANSAALVDDADSLEILAREMFVHLSSTIAEEYEALLGRRNELAQLASTASADVELTSVRRAIGTGDLNGAQRRLAHVRDALSRAEEDWEVGRILVAEGDLMVTTIRELGGDPTPATGPLEEGRRLFAEGRRADAERVLARAAVALWTILQPLLLGELHRFRDRMVEVRSAGLDIEPAVQHLRAVSVELRKRNFVGTVMSYRRLRTAVNLVSPPAVESLAPTEVAAGFRASPPA